jgi:hypothetical protein
MWKRLRQPLSLKEMLAVTGLVALAGASVYGLYWGAAALWHRHKLEEAIPAALVGVRSQREVLIGSIEAYKAQFGYYPPLFTAAGPNRGVLNPLCYELMGVRLDPKKADFHIAITKDPLEVDEVQKYFNARSFSNCVTFPASPTNFLPNRPLSVSPLTKSGELFGVSLSYPDFIPEPFWNDFDFSPWRYATNPAEHNPGKYDLWVDIDVAGKHFTIGNWPDVK